MAAETVLVTGGSGFIGRHFVAHVLASTDWNVTVVDLIHHDFRSPRVKVVLRDLRNPLGVPDVGPAEVIVNLAAESHVDRSIAGPVAFVHNNVMLALNVLEYARQVQPRRLLHVSTDEVYGPAALGRRFKEWDRHAPSNPYAASKSAQEAIMTSYWRTYGLPIAITATVNNFGPWQRDEKLIPKVIKRIKAGEPIHVHSKWTGSAWESGSRYWIHAGDHADAILAVLQSAKIARFPLDDLPTRYNVTSEDEVPNDEMVKLVGEIVGVKPKLKYVDYADERPGHDERYALDGTKIREDLGWQPKFTLQSALEQTVRRYLHPEE